MEETIKYFTNQELNTFFRELEHYNASTEYAFRCALRNEAMFKIMYYCALRATETSMLLVDDFNPLKNTIYCRRMKGGLNNTLAIVDEKILHTIKQHLKINKPETYLFENQRDHKPLSRKTMDRIIKRICAKAELKNPDKWHCHTLRHTRAVQLAEMGFDIKELQYWLGHKEISNTMIYFQFTSKQQESLYKKLRKKF